jgi:triacylglycerol lipase
MSPRRRALFIAVAVLAVLVVAGLTVPRLVARDPGPPAASDRPGPVLLVPGYGGGTASLRPLADRIRATGRVATIVTLPGDATGDLRQQAEALDRTVTETPGPVDLVGFSAGGVVARLWVQEYGGEERARRVVTLGSPHQGARIAGSAASVLPGACPTACQQLVPGSRLLAELPSPVPNPPDWLSVWTADDETVTPPESGHLPGAVNVELQSVCPTARPGHGGLPTDPTVIRLVLDALGPAPLAPPDPGC